MLKGLNSALAIDSTLARLASPSQLPSPTAGAKQCKWLRYVVAQWWLLRWLLCFVLVTHGYEVVQL